MNQTEILDNQFQEVYNLNTYKVVKDLTDGMFVVYVDDTKYLGEFNSQNIYDYTHRKYAEGLTKIFGNYFGNKKITENHYLCKVQKIIRNSDNYRHIGWALLYLEKSTAEFIPLSISIGIDFVGAKRFVMLEFPHPWNKMYMDNDWSRQDYANFKKNKHNGRIQD
jgi:hypothetical protein